MGDHEKIAKIIVIEGELTDGDFGKVFAYIKEAGLDSLCHEQLLEVIEFSRDTSLKGENIKEKSEMGRRACASFYLGLKLIKDRQTSVRDREALDNYFYDARAGCEYYGLDANSLKLEDL